MLLSMSPRGGGGVPLLRDRVESLGTGGFGTAGEVGFGIKLVFSPCRIFGGCIVEACWWYTSNKDLPALRG